MIVRQCVKLAIAAALASCILMPAGFSTAKTGVQFKFADAMREYESSNYQTAIEKFAAILQRYKAHTPSKIQIALSYYGLKEYSKSFDVFSTIDRLDIPQASYFEYAYTFYLKKKWDLAAYYFSRVSKNHPLYDLAMYYAGVSFFNLEIYDEAVKQLINAVILPSRFSTPRRNLLKLAKARNKRQRNKKELQLPGPRKNQPLPRPYRYTKEDPKKELKIVNHSLLRVPNTSINVNYYYEVTTPNFNGNNQEDIEYYNKSLGAQSGLHYAPSKVSHVGFDIHAQGNSIGGIKNIKTQTFFSEQDSLQFITKTLRLKDGQLINFGAKPWYEHQLGSYYLGFQLSRSLSLGDFAESDDYSTSQVSGYITSRASAPKVEVEIGTRAFESNNRSELEESFAKSSVTLGFESDTYLKLSLISTKHTISDKESDGPALTHKFSTTLTQLLPISAKATGEIYIASIENYLKYFNSATAFTADGMAIGASLGLHLNFSNWVSFNLGKKYDTYRWSNYSPKSSEEPWNEAVSTFDEQTFLSLTCFKNF